MKSVIIDDDIFFSEILAKKLSNLGFNTTNKIQNLNELKLIDETPDIFFIDYHLRDGSNCNEIIDYIESKHEYADVIVMSANENAADLLITGDRYIFFPKSKLKYIKYKISTIKERILKRQDTINNLKAISIIIPLVFAYILLYILLN